MEMREAVLANLTVMGKEIVRKTDPTYHPVGRWDRAQIYQAALPQMRGAYTHLRNGADLLAVLGWMRLFIPTEYKNNLSLIESMVKGELSSYWRMNPETGLIEFVEPPLK